MIAALEARGWLCIRGARRRRTNEIRDVVPSDTGAFETDEVETDEVEVRVGFVHLPHPEGDRARPAHENRNPEFPSRCGRRPGAAAVLCRRRPASRQIVHGEVYRSCRTTIRPPSNPHGLGRGRRRGHGIDVGVALTWRHPRSGLSGEVRGRGLTSHEAEGFRDRSQDENRTMVRPDYARISACKFRAEQPGFRWPCHRLSGPDCPSPCAFGRACAVDRPWPPKAG